MPNTINEVSCTSTKIAIELSDLLKFINLGCAIHPTGDFEVSDLMTRESNTRERQACYLLQGTSKYFYQPQYSLTIRDLVFYYFTKVIGNVYIQNDPKVLNINSTALLTECERQMTQSAIIINFAGNGTMDSTGTQRATVMLLDASIPGFIPGASRLVSILKQYKGSDRIPRIMEGIIDGTEIFDIHIDSYQDKEKFYRYNVNRAIVGMGEALKHNPVFGSHQYDEQSDGAVDSAYDCGE